MKEIILWHLRLGHPNYTYPKMLFPSFFKNKNTSDFQCEVCELAKHHYNYFSPQVYEKSSPFSLVQCDAWGGGEREGGLSGENNFRC